jgi:predicted membrane protein
MHLVASVVLAYLAARAEPRALAWARGLRREARRVVVSVAVALLVVAALMVWADLRRPP